MNRRTFALIGLLLCSTAYAAGTSIWNATARGTVAATDRLPVATSSSSGPLYVTPLTLQSYLLSGSATTEVLANNAGAFDGDSGFTFNATNNSVDLGGATLTTSDPVLDLAQTWSNAAIPFTAVKVNVTNVASATTSKLQDWQVDGVSLISVKRSGELTIPGVAGINFTGAYGAIASAGVLYLPASTSIGDQTGLSTSGVRLASNGHYAWSNAAAPPHTTLDTYLYRDAAATLALRNGTNAQTLRVYDTYTDASNYGRLALNTSLTGDWVQVAAETAGTGGDNYSIALTPTGTGAISAQVPDSTAAGGNARGANAVDWQSAARSLATQVASATGSTIAGGERNTASAIYASVGGGYNVAASGTHSTGSGGQSIAASGNWASIGGGSSNTASGEKSAITGGESNTASASGASIGGGLGNTADGVRSWIPGGYQSTTRGLSGAYSYSAGRRSANGDAQVIGQPVRKTTTDATPVSLATDGTPAATTVMVLPSDSTATCRAMVTANSTAAGVVSMAGFDAIAIVKNDSSTMTISGGTCTAIGTADAALTTATCALVVNGTRDSIEVEVTGVAATTIYWMAEVRCVQAL